VRLEALVIAAAHPRSAAEFLAQGLGLPAPHLLSDAQFALSGVGTFLPASRPPPASPPGSSTGHTDEVAIWLRVGDLTDSVARLVSLGAELVDPPAADQADTCTGTGPDTEADDGTGASRATVRIPDGLRIALIT